MNLPPMTQPIATTAGRTPPTIALVGRTNVGKSTLFNRLTESRGAITSPLPGTTRDRSYGTVRWHAGTLRLIDTGGVDVGEITASVTVLRKPGRPPKARDTDLDTGMLAQARLALQEADLIVMVVDATAGVMPADRALAASLKRLGKPIQVVANKVDRSKQRAELAGFHALGLGEALPVSAKNGQGSGDLLDAIAHRLGGVGPLEDAAREIRVAIVGKPNVGKSSLLNAIVGFPRVIVSPQPLTTREPQDTVLEFNGQRIRLIDTAGLRRHARVEGEIETEAAARSREILRQAHVALFVIEANEPIAKQDSTLAGDINESNASCIIVANKWDLVSDKHGAINKTVAQTVARYLAGLAWANVVAVSAKTGDRVGDLLPMILELAERRRLETTPEQLTTLLAQLTRKRRPVGGSGIEHPYIHSLTQTHVDPPVFLVTIGADQTLHFSYLRYVINAIRIALKLDGVNFKVKITQANIQLPGGRKSTVRRRPIGRIIPRYNRK